jgi:hypothetical protein
VLGTILLNKSYFDTQTIEVDVTALTNGLYVLQVKSNNKTFTTKFIKE